MSIALFTNYAVSSLAAGINSTATSLSVASGAGALFPVPAAGQYFVLLLTDNATKLQHEIVWVTAVSGDTFTIVRGQENTTPRTWANGDICFLGLSMGQMGIMGQKAAIQLQAYTYGVDTGGTNAYVVTLTPAITAYVDGMVVSFRAGSNNTGACTLAVNGLSAVSLYLPGGVSPPAGAILGGYDVTVQYDNSSGWQILSAVSVTPTQSPGNNSLKFASTAYTDAAVAAAFATRSLSQNGYQVLDGGLILQWGQLNSTTGAGDPVIFPLTFPNHTWSLNITNSAAAGWGGTTPEIVGSQLINNSQFDLYVYVWTGSGFAPTGGVAVDWIAIGD